MALTNGNEEFKRVNALFEDEVIARKNFGAVAEVYSEDARILPPGADLLTGLSHIQAFWEQAVTALNVKALKLTSIDLEVTGETAVEVGEAEMMTDQPTSPNKLKYVVIWKKTGQGWRWQTDIWNAAAEAHQK